MLTTRDLKAGAFLIEGTKSNPTLIRVWHADRDFVHTERCDKNGNGRFQDYGGKKIAIANLSKARIATPQEIMSIKISGRTALIARFNKFFT